jgi:IS1 family transposase/transposase-like protein
MDISELEAAYSKYGWCMDFVERKKNDIIFLKYWREKKMVLIPIECPHCKSNEVTKFGMSSTGKQRYNCNNCKKTFQREYSYTACNPSTRSKIYFQTINGSGTRAIARNLGIDPGTVTSTLKSFEPLLWQVNYDYLLEIENNEAELDIVCGTEIEMDEMWSFVHDKSQQYWLWWAIDHKNGKPLAFCFGTREHSYLEELKKLLIGFNITTVFTDGNSAYKENITECELVVGKENTQKIERKHLSLRTWCSRLVRKGIRFSKSRLMHFIVVSLVINYWFFGRILAQPINFTHYPQQTKDCLNEC